MKVETPVGTFALKQKKMTLRQIENIHRVYPLIRNLVIDAIGPLPSKYGDLVIEMGGRHCYLSPWVEETVPESALEERYRHLFAGAGMLHRQTITDEKDAVPLYGSVARLLLEHRKRWTSFFETAERHVYPSPFEQIVLSRSATVIISYRQALDFFSSGAAGSRESTIVTGKMRHALCHGRLSPHHLLIENERSLLMNFEESNEDVYILEAAALMEQAAVTLDPDRAQWPQLFHRYFSSCPPTREEMAFLYHLLVCPGVHGDLVQSYYRQRRPDEYLYTKRLVRLLHGYDRLIGQLGSFIRNMHEKQQAPESENGSDGRGGSN